MPDANQIDTRYRHADRMRQTLARTQSISWVTRQRFTTALARYEKTTGPSGDSPAAAVLDGLISLGEICADPNAKRCPNPDWIASAIERHLQANPDL